MKIAEKIKEKLRCKTERNPKQTRKVILEKAFQEVLKHGFQATSLDSILSKTGLTKGAFYHHFPNKTALGYAIVDNIIDKIFSQEWDCKYVAGTNPIDYFKGFIKEKVDNLTSDELTFGCPLNNLIQEMSPLDEGFRSRLENVYVKWSLCFEGPLKQGQEDGFVRKDIDPKKVATFIVAAMEGCAGAGKNSQSKQVFVDCADGLMDYLDGLRAKK